MGRIGRACLFLIALLLALAGMKGCCDSTGLSLGRFSTFMDLSYRLTVDIDLSLFASFKLSGRIGAWAGIELLADAELNIDLGEVTFERASVEEDIDRDGKKESVSLLAAIDRLSGETVRIFVAWKGDEYTQDEGRCYLAWVEGDSLRLASAPCGGEQSALLCSAPVEEPESLSCQACGESGGCQQCDTGGRVDDCWPEETADAAAGPVDAGVYPDAGEDAATGVDASLQVDIAACEKQVVKLGAEAAGCGLEIAVDERALCESSAAEVADCFAAYFAADTLGQDACPLLEQELSCGVLR